MSRRTDRVKELKEGYEDQKGCWNCRPKEYGFSDTDGKYCSDCLRNMEPQGDGEND